MQLHEQLAANFYRWELRGRASELFPAPVQLEPPFVQFPEGPQVDRTLGNAWQWIDRGWLARGAGPQMLIT